uniref:(northern house mosquito) hypothetical protein n=1 Tax=Culex pipiens TaxID=7175 RepID=A0A8D8FQP6_CULPI
MVAAAVLPGGIGSTASALVGNDAEAVAPRCAHGRRQVRSVDLVAAGPDPGSNPPSSPSSNFLASSSRGLLELANDGGQFSTSRRHCYVRGKSPFGGVINQQHNE